jgi:uncharacterized membrane protein
MSVTHIRNPIEWSGATLAQMGRGVSTALNALQSEQVHAHVAAPPIRKITVSDLFVALRKGYADFAAYRSDVVVLCLVYVVAGLVIARLTLGRGLLPLLFPLASGFAILGPLFGVGLYEMSKRREQGTRVSWTNAFAVTGEEGFTAIVMLGALLIFEFLVWLAAAYLIFRLTMSPATAASAPRFLTAVFTTPGGYALIAIGCGVGFLFALLALCLGIVSFPMLLDNGRIGLGNALAASFRAVARNPVALALWGLIVAALLILGTVPFFLGLVIVLPLLGHATWHLYRRLTG